MPIHIKNRFKITKYLIGIFVVLLTNQLSAANDSLLNTLSELDQYIERKNQYENEKKNRIGKLFIDAKQEKDDVKLYGLYEKLFNEYEPYNYDSSYVYAQKLIDLSSKLNDGGKAISSKISLAYCNISAGLFLESIEVLKSIDSIGLDSSRKIALYSLYEKLYLDMANSIIVEPYFTQYNQQSIKYSKAIINLMDTDNPNRNTHLINIYRCQQQYDKAIEAIKYQLATINMDKRATTLCKGGLGQFYLLSGDTAKSIPYLINAAIDDIKSVTKETPALSILAEIMYNSGDIERAYSYAKCSLDDANYYNARHRKIEVGNVLPIIEVSRYKIIEKQKNTLFLYAVLVSVLIVSFLISTIVIWKQVKQLRVARKVIEQQNDDLQQINTSLKNANKIKDEYIGHFFRLNSAYMDDIERFQKKVSRKVANKQYDDLSQILKKTDFNKERENKLASFDNIILKLFPHFVTYYNSLFDKNNQVEFCPENEFTTEMRIFALIRLGITDSADIAKFLNYSVNTISTYKTKVKNRSKIPNDLFELKIMEIESVKYE